MSYLLLSIGKSIKMLTQLQIPLHNLSSARFSCVYISFAPRCPILISFETDPCKCIQSLENYLLCIWLGEWNLFHFGQSSRLEIFLAPESLFWVIFLDDLEEINNL